MTNSIYILFAESIYDEIRIGSTNTISWNWTMCWSILKIVMNILSL